jgi:hypothetical protein
MGFEQYLTLAVRSKSTCFCFRLQRSTTRTVATAAHGNGDSSRQSFYQKLGSPQHILAPMVAQSDLPFRLMCEQLYNVDLSYTQMIHAYNFVESNGEVFRRNHLDVYPHSVVRNILLGNANRDDIPLSISQLNALRGLSERDIDASRRRILEAINKNEAGESDFVPIKPTVVQIAAHDPDIAAEAALLILDRSGSSIDGNYVPPVAAIDLNLGEFTSCVC